MGFKASTSFAQNNNVRYQTELAFVKKVVDY